MGVPNADVMKLVDINDLGSLVRKGVQVRPLSSVQEVLLRKAAWPGGGIGRHRVFKRRCSKECEGSSPFLVTIVLM